METQFDREIMLLGEENLRKLQNAHVAVFGIGGVGSYTAEALARAGVGAITLVDNDTVSLTNLNRQLIALHSTIGRNKTDVMAERIRDINPACRVTSLPVIYEEASKEQFFAMGFDYIADCIDMVSCKLSLIRTAIERGVPIVSSMGTGNRLDPTKFTITDLAKTSGDPLSRVMRHELRKCGIVHHDVLFSAEPPLSPAPLAQMPAGKRSVPGSVSWVPSSAGLLIAGYIIGKLTK